MEFRILGPVEVVDEGRVVDLGSPKQRALLAVLLLEANRPVSVDRLIDELWDDHPPKAATEALQAYVSNLRRVLEPGRDAGAPPTVLVHQRPGYLLRVGPAQLDAWRFAELAEHGRRALHDADAPRAYRLFSEALSLWRGPALADVSAAHFATGTTARLEELRLATLEDRFDAELQLGRHPIVAGEAAQALTAHPFRERLRAQLMLAMYRSGRQADALRIYREGRRVLVDELGLEPGPALAQLEGDILRHAPHLDWRPDARVRRRADGRRSPGEATNAEPPGGADDSHPLLGRGQELDALVAAIEAARAGVGTAVLIEGEAGIGKSRLLTEVLPRAAAGGLTVLYGRCDELEQDRPFAAFIDALELDHSDPDPGAARLASLLVGDGLALGQHPRGDLGFRVVEALLADLEEHAVRGGAVLALEDLHWADPATLKCLRTLARRLPRVPVAVLATLRPSPTAPLLDRVVEELLGRGGRHLMLGPLDEAATTALVARLAASPPGPRLRKQVTGAGGNPLFVIELVAALQHEGAITVADGLAEVDEPSLPPSLRLTILRRLSVLPEETLRLLQVAAVLGPSFSLADLGAVTGRTAVDLLALMHAALRAGLVGGDAEDRLRFRHQLIREAVYSDLPAAACAALHSQIGHALAEFGRPARQVALHLSLGAQVGDKEAVGWLRRAALDAGPRSPAVAVELLTRALMLTESTSERERLRADLLEPLAWTGRLADAEALARDLLAAEPEIAVSVLVRNALSAALAFRGDMRGALAQLDAAAHETGVPDITRASLIASGSMARVFTGDLPGARAAGERAVSEGERLGNDHAVSMGLQTLAVVAQTDGRVEDARGLATRAVAVARRPTPTESFWDHQHFAHLNLGWVLLNGDRHQEAEAAFQAGRRQLEEAAAVTVLPLYFWGLVVLRYVSGAWDDAITEAEAGFGLAEETENRFGAAIPHAFLARIAVHRGDLPGAEAAAEAARREAIRGVPGHDWALWANALLLEARGASGDAHLLLADAWDAGAHLRWQVSYRFLAPDLVRLALAVGARERATEVTQQVEEGARRAEVASAMGVALRCRGLLEDEPEMLRGATEALASAARPVEAAHAAAEAGVRFLARGDAAAAREHLESALRAYEAVGAARDVNRVAAALHALGVRRRGATRRQASRGWESLTRSELAVVRLATQGLTNRQIGERLFISRRTVETHLSHVFAKLDIATRTQLAGLAARRLPS